ncbi:MAG: glycosyltransferase family 2 protein [Alphaproteobacteria bacterium]
MLFDTLTNILNDIAPYLEIICINDENSDKTEDIRGEYRAADPRIKIVSFSRNFGKEAALTAGLDYASGDAVIIIDADLQDPPELIAAFVGKWREGFDVVYGQRRTRVQDTWLKRTSAAAFYVTLSKVSGVGMPRNVGDFRLMAGETKFNFSRLMTFALDGITGFSTLPLLLAGYLGVLVASLSLLYGLFLAIKTLVQGAEVPGYASLMVVMLFLGGTHLMVMGIIGEYIGRIYQEGKARPLYLIDKTVGFDQKPPSPAPDA